MNIQNVSPTAVEYIVNSVCVSFDIIYIVFLKSCLLVYS